MFAVLGVVAALGFGFFVYSADAPHSKQSREVRWLIAHEPTEVFDRAAQVFADELARKSEGTLTLVVLKPEDVGSQHEVSKSEGYALMDAGTIDMMSVFGAAVGSEVDEALAPNTPFLFTDYDAAEAFFVAKGDQLLDTVSTHTRLTALAVTYSGGFRVLAFMKPVEDIVAAARQHVAAIDDATSRLASEVLGVPFVASEEEHVSDVAVDGAEVTYSRIAARTSFDGIDTILETNHGFLYTMIVAYDAFFDSLSTEEQRWIRESARSAAAIERADSIALSNRTRQDLIDAGVTVRSVDSATQTRLTDTARAGYAMLPQKIQEFLRD